MSTPEVSLESYSRRSLVLLGVPHVGLFKGHSREGSLIFLLSQFPSVVTTGHVLRELNQVSAGGECPSRPWRARAKSDLQVGGPENRTALPPACQGALALSGVLRRLQLVEEKILQVKASPFTLPVPESGVPSIAPLPPLARGGFLLLLFTPCLPSSPMCGEAMRQACPTASRLSRGGSHPSLCHYLFFSFSFLTLTAEEGSELGQQGISQKEH